MAWNSMGKEFAVVIDLPTGADSSYYDSNVMYHCKTRLSSLGCMWFCILHNKDLNNDGDSKIIHYHMVIVTPNRKRCSTVCYLLSTLLNDLDINLIRVQVCLSLPLSVQYLTHKNNSEKYQYNFNDITTNNKNTLADLFAYDTKSIKIDEVTLYQLVDSGYEEEEILFKIGLGNFQCYRSTIRMLLEAHKIPSRWQKINMLFGVTDGD